MPWFIRSFASCCVSRIKRTLWAKKRCWSTGGFLICYWMKVRHWWCHPGSSSSPCSTKSWSQSSCQEATIVYYGTWLSKIQNIISFALQSYMVTTPPWCILRNVRHVTQISSVDWHFWTTHEHTLKRLQQLISDLGIYAGFHFQK